MRDLLALLLHFLTTLGRLLEPGGTRAVISGDIADQASTGDPVSLLAKGTQTDNRGPHRNAVMHFVYEP